MSTVRFDIVDTLGRITLTSPPYDFVGVQFNTDLATAVPEASDSDIRALLIQASRPVAGSDLGTGRGEFGGNRRDVVKQAGQLNVPDLER